MTKSAFDAPSSPLIKNLGWMSIDDLISSESKQLVFKKLNNQAPKQWRLVREFTGGARYGAIKMGIFYVSIARDTTIYIREILGVINFRRK